MSNERACRDRSGNTQGSKAQGGKTLVFHNERFAGERSMPDVCLKTGVNSEVKTDISYLSASKGMY